jgi:hypothetical protein
MCDKDDTKDSQSTRAVEGNLVESDFILVLRKYRWHSATANTEKFIVAWACKIRGHPKFKDCMTLAHRSVPTVYFASK